MKLTIKEIYEKFTDLYFPMINNYQKNIVNFEKSTVLSDRFLSEYRKAPKWILKHCGVLVPPKASKSALEIAGDKIDLFRLQWKDQPLAEEIITGKKGRELFIHEHQYPVDDLYKELLRAEDRNTILETLQKQSIVWITREEDKMLKRNNRSEDAYESANIKIFDNPYGDSWMERSFIK